MEKSDKEMKIWGAILILMVVGGMNKKKEVYV